MKAKNKKNREKKFIVLLISGIALVGLSFTFGTLSQHYYDKKRFESLSVFMQDLASSLQSSNAPAPISYSESCNDIYAGAFASGEITCQVSLTAELQTSQPQDISALHKYYYPAIAANSDLLPNSPLDIQPIDVFGNTLATSSAEQSFSITTVSDVVCTYLLSVQQSTETSGNFSLGTAIDNTAVVLLEFRCSDKARDYWFTRT